MCWPIPSDATSGATATCGPTRAEALERLAERERPAASAHTRLCGTWATAWAVAAERAGGMESTEMASALSSARESISLPKPRESTAKTERSERR